VPPNWHGPLRRGRTAQRGRGHKPQNLAIVREKGLRVLAATRDVRAHKSGFHCGSQLGDKLIWLRVCACARLSGSTGARGKNLAASRGAAAGAAPQLAPSRSSHEKKAPSLKISKAVNWLLLCAKSRLSFRPAKLGKTEITRASLSLRRPPLAFPQQLANRSLSSLRWRVEINARDAVQIEQPADRHSEPRPSHAANELAERIERIRIL
jgi:hypothetical protein